MQRHTAIANLLNDVKKTMQLTSDAALARVLGVSGGRISHLRSGRQIIGDAVILQLHELTGMPIRDIKGRLGMQCLERYQVFR